MARWLPRPDLVVSSPLRRARQTAAAFGADVRGRRALDRARLRPVRRLAPAGRAGRACGRVGGPTTRLRAAVGASRSPSSPREWRSLCRAVRAGTDVSRRRRHPRQPDQGGARVGPRRPARWSRGGCTSRTPASAASTSSASGPVVRWFNRSRTLGGARRRSVPPRRPRSAARAPTPRARPRSRRHARRRRRQGGRGRRRARRRRRAGAGNPRRRR